MLTPFFMRFPWGFPIRIMVTESYCQIITIYIMQLLAYTITAYDTFNPLALTF